VVDPTRHEEWHQYHQQQLIRMVHQIDRQQKVTGGLAVRFSSFVTNKAGGPDDGSQGITVDLLAFATYWIGAGMAIGVLAWSVSERRWLPAGAMLLFALGAMYLAYREIRPADRSEGRHGRSSEEEVDLRDLPMPDQQQRQPAFTPVAGQQPPPMPAPPQRSYLPSQPPPPGPPPQYPLTSYDSGHGQAYGSPNGNARPVDNGWH
jgi:hypothetical protein